jgi:peptidyl-tRNA hydrolase
MDHAVADFSETTTVVARREEKLERAKTASDVAKAQVQSAREQLKQAEAAL